VRVEHGPHVGQVDRQRGARPVVQQDRVRFVEKRLCIG
jgi:hypothetical protein